MKQTPAPPEPGAPRPDSMTEASPLSADNLLIAEFEYIGQTAFQAGEDRSRITSFYLITSGSLVAAILGTQADDLQDPQTYFAFAALFFVLAFSGVLTLLQLVRLRQAWAESARAMNQIKEYYVEHLRELDLARALRWRMTTLPRAEKPWSVAYLLALQVASLGGIILGAAVMFLGYGFGQILWGFAIPTGFVFAAVQMAVYHRLLSARPA